MLDVYRQSRGKGLTDLPVLTQRQAVRSRTLVWYTLVAGVLLLTGCASLPVTTIYHVEAFTYVSTSDQALLDRACWNAYRYADGLVSGCYVPIPPIVYCPANDPETCWHEVYLHHIKGETHDAPRQTQNE